MLWGVVFGRIIDVGGGVVGVYDTVLEEYLSGGVGSLNGSFKEFRYFYEGGVVDAGVRGRGIDGEILGI